MEAEHAILVGTKFTFHNGLDFTANEAIDVTLTVPALAADLYLLEDAVLVPTVERHLGDGEQTCCLVNANQLVARCCGFRLEHSDGLGAKKNLLSELLQILH